jgi:hypothetical protein
MAEQQANGKGSRNGREYWGNLPEPQNGHGQEVSGDEFGKDYHDIIFFFLLGFVESNLIAKGQEFSQPLATKYPIRKILTHKRSATEFWIHQAA